ncbi:hypothetical protein [Aegicerativicinus sediminis]|uniref:hypothetical protein n=1 Tax=Aegicerativicinus sediminis TaxID=2893202 RepID=UPI001E33329E|nr:hypothetical protein [Aegicerativicinus sediminis]
MDNFTISQKIKSFKVRRPAKRIRKALAKKSENLKEIGESFGLRMYNNYYYPFNYNAFTDGN